MLYDQNKHEWSNQSAISYAMLDNGKRIYIRIRRTMEKAVYETTIWYTGNLVGYISVNSMDVPRIMNMFEESKVLMNTSHCDRLMEMLDFVEYVAIEDKMTELFQQRVMYICMANNFRMAMERDYGRKQIKRFLVICGYDDRVARSTAEKLNLARRVYTHFAEIVNNCFKCPSIDIRNLTINELSLAKNLSWVIKRSVEVKPKKRIPKDVPVEVDEGSVLQSVEELTNSTWFQQAQDNPVLVASILC